MKRDNNTEYYRFKKLIQQQISFLNVLITENTEQRTKKFTDPVQTRFFFVVF